VPKNSDLLIAASTIWVVITAVLSSLGWSLLFVVGMFAVAVVTSARRVGAPRAWPWVAISMAAGVLPVLAIVFASGAVPWQGAALVPVAGIIIGGAMVALGLGFWAALVCVGFYAIFPVMRNAVVGLQGVNPDLLESAKGMGMNETRSLVQVRLPLAWPVILAGLRVSTQMSMGVAAIAAYVLGPGFGVWIFTGLAQTGGKNGVNYALSATLAIVVIALLFDLLLLLLGRVTISKGIRAT